MAGHPRVGDLEIAENMKAQAAEWFLEMVGTLVLFGIVITAFTGVLGKDPSTKKIAGAEGERLWAEYERFARWQTRTMLELHAMPTGLDKKAAISINDDYLKDMMIEQVMPEPDSVDTKFDKTTFTFTGSASDEPLVIRFHLQPEKPGSKDARITLGEEHALRFKQIVLP